MSTQRQETLDDVSVCISQEQFLKKDGPGQYELYLPGQLSQGREEDNST